MEVAPSSLSYLLVVLASIEDSFVYGELAVASFIEEENRDGCPAPWDQGASVGTLISLNKPAIVNSSSSTFPVAAAAAAAAQQTTYPPPPPRQ
ncbi:hypothetical protein DM860_006101 [Cuscuta australis]|uniref:Uncharacterized protein n=1 Tax=Cuscuta australis TaxID=267555 RepID=A0A328DJY2_9ASTE|nr:hypothetical protein DM860_006101 [Cuscuta australis]